MVANVEGNAYQQMCTKRGTIDGARSNARRRGVSSHECTPRCGSCPAICYDAQQDQLDWQMGRTYKKQCLIRDLSNMDEAANVQSPPHSIMKYNADFAQGEWHRERHGGVVGPTGVVVADDLRGADRREEADGETRDGEAAVSDET